MLPQKLHKLLGGIVHFNTLYEKAIFFMSSANKDITKNRDDSPFKGKLYITTHYHTFLKAHRIAA